MFRISAIALILSIGVSAGARADVPALHSGNADPITEGFTKLAGINSVAPVNDDAGYSAWQIVSGNNTTAYYFKPFDYVPAFQQGWKMTARLRLVETPGGSASFAYFGLNTHPGIPRFDVVVSRSGADAKIELFQSSLSYTLPGAAASWILAELRYDPVSKTAALSVNGTEVLSGYEGIQYFNEGRGLDFGGVNSTANFNLVRFQFGPEEELAGFTLKRSTVAGCKSVTGTVTLPSAAPPGGMPVTITETLASVNGPITVTVPAGASSKNFALKTKSVATDEEGTVSATLGGSTLSQNLTVRPMGMSSVSLTPNPAVGGNVVDATAKLECKAGPGPILVELSSSDAAVASPDVPSVVIPVGAQTAAFTVETAPVAAITKPKIIGKANGITKSKTLTVTP
jgi:hypothetical protein